MLVQLVVFVISFISLPPRYSCTASPVVAHSVCKAGSRCSPLRIVEPANTGTIAVGLITAFVGLVVRRDSHRLPDDLCTLRTPQNASAVAQLGLWQRTRLGSGAALPLDALLGTPAGPHIYDRWWVGPSDVRLKPYALPILNQFRSSQPKTLARDPDRRAGRPPALESTTLAPECQPHRAGSALLAGDRDPEFPSGRPRTHQRSRGPPPARCCRIQRPLDASRIQHGWVRGDGGDAADAQASLSVNAWPRPPGGSTPGSAP